MTCKLCDIRLDSKAERVHYRDASCAVLDTIDKKGHDNRIMVMLLRHSEFPATVAEELHLRKMLRQAAERVFVREPGYWVYEASRFTSVPMHWHIIASDQRPLAPDVAQAHKSPRKWWPNA